jgi:threonine/homoserine/homoserine lactone efflux protein
VREVIGQILPFAVVAALSPIPIIAVVLMLSTPRARVNGPVFLAGWVIGLAVLGVVLLTVASGLDASDPDSQSSVSTLKLVLGIGMFVVASRQWRKRPHGDEQAAMPKWMGAVDAFSPAKAFVAGIALVAVNPKNLIITIAAAATISQSGLSGSDQAIAYAVYAALATVGVAIPLVIYFAMGERAAAPLASLKSWMGTHNAAIMAAICLVIGAKLIGDALPGI